MVESAVAESARARSAAQILIVDDQPANLTTLTEILNREGFTVRQAVNGQTALRTAQTVPPDLILLDIRMPQMNGYEVCSSLKADQTTRNIPVIFLSALDDVLDKSRAFSIGGVDYITKPFNVDEVVVRVQHQLTIQLQRQQLLDLNHQLQRINSDLERQVQVQTLELRQALLFERTLKRISDQVRDTLDQHQILRSAVEELARTLKVDCCDAALYSRDRLTSVIHYQYVRPGQAATLRQAINLTEAPDIYEQLQQKQCFAFCQIQSSPIRNHAAILVCPIYDDQVEQNGSIGDLWVFKPLLSSFGKTEIRLVEQVANQCAVALRQARLYQAAEDQVQELERLNQLKDRYLTEKEALLAEVHHRVKNNLQIIRSLISLQMRQLDNPQMVDLLQEIQNRVHSMALIHEMLYRSADFSAIDLSEYLKAVVRQLLRVYEAARRGIVWVLDTEGVTLNLEQAVPCGLLVNELVSNALKHAFAGERRGTLTVRCHADAETGQIILLVEDDGVGLPAEINWRTAESLGLHIVQSLLRQLDGVMECQVERAQPDRRSDRPSGTRFSIRFPISRG